MIRTCAAEEDCEGIVNMAIAVAGVEAAAFLREMPDSTIRVSLRGKGLVNVAAVAERLGGGGHLGAAGCALIGPLQQAIEHVLTQLRLSMVSFRHSGD
jgi:phosphoesterase RecJ-like protein